MRRAKTGKLHILVAPRMRAALPFGAVGDANAARHDVIVAILMGALATDTLGHCGVVEIGGTQHALAHGFFLSCGMVGVTLSTTYSTTVESEEGKLVGVTVSHSLS